MNLKSNKQLKRFRNIYNNSGCVSSNYKISNNDLEISHIEYEQDEISGEFNINKVKFNR
ncbi:hypothetical protein [Clostridium kluyveri]|uniref:Uncharacterized protein n=1 Tax=Clostridium kluyveri (strain ATCC 8527 / DSM 555 / NBRC 12016 / NCIMB 10680 / K1) TaxID=431943 RepID=A5N722_CLOK5|nr:hypothetical protein [Clostridium kluyveri]EDK33103.1 Hypothetical protein CKL_1061 [Clostridium kluyveri DSM 555]